MWSHTYGAIYLRILGCVCIMGMCAWWRAGAVPRWRHTTIQGQVMLEDQAACRVVLLQGESAAALRAPARWSSEAWCFRITDIYWHRLHWEIHLLSSKPAQSPTNLKDKNDLRAAVPNGPVWDFSCMWQPCQQPINTSVNALQIKRLAQGQGKTERPEQHCPVSQAEAWGNTAQSFGRG